MTGNNRLIPQERDRHLLRELATVRVVDREQTKLIAGFRSTTRTNARLLGLVQAGLLRRFFIGNVAGHRKALYALSGRGAELVGVPQRGPQRRNDELLVADYFVRHQLTINEIYLALRYGMLPPAVEFGRWRAFFEPLTPTLKLIPDGYFELKTPSDSLAAFLEVDLGNESLKVLQGKVRNYLHLALSGYAQERLGPKQFRVLILTTTERRLRSIRQAVAPITQKLFWLATLEACRAQGLFAPIWLRPTGDQKQPLLKELA